MYQIYNLVSDGKLTDELVNDLRNRVLDQKFLYLNEGGGFYYKFQAVDEIYTHSFLKTDDLIKFGIEKNFNKDEKSAFISLGCGTSTREKPIFEKIGKEYPICYIGVDTSRQILEESVENMGKIKFKIPPKFICADFGTNEFRRELGQLTTNLKKRMFVFFSNTFGNFNPTNITDILYNLLDKGEKIRLDVRLRKGTNAKDDMELTEKYFNYLKGESMSWLYFNLQALGIPSDNGKMILTTNKEESIGALKFQYSFLFTKKTTTKIKYENITILPGEKIDMLKIQAYDETSLVNFFKEHNFKLIDKIIKEVRGHFIFEKI